MAGYLNVPGTGHLKESATTVQANGETVDMLRQDWTLDCWVRTTAAGGSIILRRNEGQTPDNFNYYLGISANGTLLGRFAIDYSYRTVVNFIEVVVYERNYALNNIVGEVPINDGLWHHVAYVRSGSGCALYVDGVLDVTQDRLKVPPNIPDGAYVQRPSVFAETGPCSFGQGMNGDLDEIRIWNRALASAELRDVKDRNLSGNERGLVSYFNFDAQNGLQADERAAGRDPDSEYGVYIPGANRVLGGPPIIYDQLLSLGVTLRGLFMGNDGGVWVEDRMHRIGTDPFDGWMYAGRRGAAVTFASQSPLLWGWMDADGDGLPDWWERLNGFDPYNGDTDGNGISDFYDDPDHDGLPNFAELLAGTDPRNPDTDFDGYSDYDSPPTSWQPYGVRHTDNDYTEDWWESQYAAEYAYSVHYDSQLDPDDDGWDNWSEARYEAKSGVITQPDSGETAPVPQVAVTLYYPGLSRGAVVVLAYSDRAMDGEPDATFELPAPAYYPFTFTTNSVPVAGRLRQRSNWFFAIMDMNGNRQWDAGEPAGLADRFPYDVGWDKNALSFTLSDKPVNGFVRLPFPTVSGGTNGVPGGTNGLPAVTNTLPLSPGAELHSVEIGRITWAGTNAVFTRIFSKNIRGPRNWIHEGDILDPNAAVGGGKPGLDWDGRITGTPTIPITTTSTYELRVDGVKAGGSNNYFVVYYSSNTLPTPVAQYPRGAIVTSPRPEFRWTMSAFASAFELQILTTNAFTDEVVYSSGTNAAPSPRNADGLRVWSPPIHWGDIVPALNGGNGALTNAAFRWRVRAFQPRLVTGFTDFNTHSSSISAYSSNETVQVNLNDTVIGLASIKVRVGAHYLPTNVCIRVQAFESGSLNDLPVVQRTLLNVTNLPQTVMLSGLKNQQPYYIAVYMDQNTNNAREVWESWGYYRSSDTSPKWYFQPLTVQAAKAPAVPTVTVMIRSVDTDQDKISDSYEYKVSGGLGGTPVMPMGFVSEGIKSKTSEFNWLNVLGLVGEVYGDRDGDGINDKLEFDLGLSATSADQLRITGMGGDNKLNWALTSAADPVGMLSTTTLAESVTYVLERTDSLDTPRWKQVKEVGSKDKAGAFDLGNDMSKRPAGFYRVRVVTP
jgi:hypothetical protein